MRRPLLGRAAGLLLVLTGGYVAWYGWYEIRVFADAGASDPVIERAAALQSTVSGWVAGIGPGAVAAIVAGLLAAAGGAALVRRRAAARSTAPIAPADRADATP